MQTPPPELMLTNHNGRNHKGKPGFGASVLKLYRNDQLWRGAVDLFFIGLLMMCLTFGFPDIFSGLGKLFGRTPPVTNTAATTPPMPTAGPAPSPLPATQSASGLQLAATPTTPVPTTATPIAPAATSIVPAVTPPGNLSANFGRALNDTAHQQPAPNAVPTPFHYNDRLAKDWIGPLTADDRRTLDAAADLVGMDDAKAMGLVNGLARAGNPNAQYIIGGALVHSAFLQHKPAALNDAVAWYNLAARQGLPAAQFQLGQIYRIGAPGFTPDLKLAAAWYQFDIRNPLNKSAEPENELARMYEAGIYFPKDIQQAKALYESAANKGYPPAELNLAALYFNGALGARDISLAIGWMRKSAEAGWGAAEISLGQLNLRGIGMPVDYAQFLRWTGYAADQGVPDAMIALGDFYREGRPDFPADQQLAAKYYRLAALKKNGKAQFMLGQMYQAGLGLPADRIQAYIYYSLSYHAGFSPAFQAMRSAEVGLTPAELDYARHMEDALKAAPK